jgi:chorismate mutase
VAAAALSTKHALTAAAPAPFVPPLAQLQHMAVLALQKATPVSLGGLPPAIVVLVVRHDQNALDFSYLAPAGLGAVVVWLD